MGESIKAVCSLILLVALITAAFVWFEDQPDQTTWIIRFVAPALAGIALAVLLKVHFRRDHAPDYLAAVAGTYFNRGGFCFALAPTAVEGVCQLHAYFQNQYERACLGRIVLRPSQGFFLTRAKLDAIAFEIPCDGGAFGVVSIPVPLPRNVQGRRQAFDVGASVEYPEGRGRRLRFRDGIFLRANSQFRDSFRTGVTLLGTLAGGVVLSSPAKITLDLPTDVAEETPSDAKPQRQVLWKPGDSPLGAHDGKRDAP